MQKTTISGYQVLGNVIKGTIGFDGVTRDSNHAHISIYKVFSQCHLFQALVISHPVVFVARPSPHVSVSIPPSKGRSQPEKREPS
jgi:hypothetical protein